MKTTAQVTYGMYLFQQEQLRKLDRQRRERKRRELYHFLKFYKDQRRQQNRGNVLFETLVPMIHEPLGETCAICLEKNETEKCHRKLKVCNHRFHDKCIRYWIKRGNWNCPLCRACVQQTV